MKRSSVRKPSRKTAQKKAARPAKKAAKKASAKSSAKPAAKKVARKSGARRVRARAPEPLSHAARRGVRAYEPPELPLGGLGADGGGQSGDIEGLSRRSSADSQSVVELLEEGQSWEAGVVSGVEEADGGGEVTTREVPEDDVPLEYLDQ